MKKKVLVIGANGFTGRRILNDLSRNDEYIVTGCSLHDDIAPDSGNYRFISADICQMGEQSALFREVRPNIVINTSALSVPDYCRQYQCQCCGTIGIPMRSIRCTLYTSIY
mgnify:CR=1 FL=1